jgi:hypothetical protein
MRSTKSSCSAEETVPKAGGFGTFNRKEIHMTQEQPARRDVLKNALAGAVGLTTGGGAAAKPALPASGETTVTPQPAVPEERYLPDVIKQRELEAALAFSTAAEYAVASFFHRMFRGATIEPGELTIEAARGDYDEEPGWPSKCGGFNMYFPQNGPEIFISTSDGAAPVLAPPDRFVRDVIKQEEMESAMDVKNALDAIMAGLVNRIYRGAAVEHGPLTVSPNSWREIGPESTLTICHTGAPQSAGTGHMPAPVAPRGA